MGGVGEERRSLPPTFNMDLTNLHVLSASEATRLIRDGVITSEQLVRACLNRVSETDSRVQAWAFLDADHALAQARAADEWRLGGRPTVFDQQSNGPGADLRAGVLEERQPEDPVRGPEGTNEQ